jgi:hypothetical protein
MSRQQHHNRTGTHPETLLAKAQGVLANVPSLLLFLDGSVALDDSFQDF